MAIAIRSARADDLEDIEAIYHHYVLNTHATFDVAAEPRSDWFAQFDGSRYRCLLAVSDEHEVAGYACSGPFKHKRAYETSVEVSIYLAPLMTHRGLGGQLYRALFGALSGEDLHRAYAGIALPNDASLALHRRFGFAEVAHYHEVGRKFDRYWDVVWLERALPFDPGALG